MEKRNFGKIFKKIDIFIKTFYAIHERYTEVNRKKGSEFMCKIVFVILALSSAILLGIGAWKSEKKPEKPYVVRRRYDGYDDD